MDTRTFIEQLARGAGEITLKYFQSAELVVDNKTNDTPVTRADREAEQFLRDQIHRVFPTDGILGEEFGEESGTSGRRWILDPLDGTKTFVRGVPLYGTVIALEEKNEIIAGAVFIPGLSEMVSAVRGEGAEWNGKPCHVSDIADPKEACLVTTDDYSLRQKIGQVRHLELFEKARMFRTWGDCYGHLLVATGRAEAMFDAQISIWDTAAFAVIIEEAGGKYVDFKGQRSYTRSSMITTNAALHTHLMHLVTTERAFV